MTGKQSVAIGVFYKSVCQSLEKAYSLREASQLALILLEHFTSVSKLSLMTEPNLPVADHIRQLIVAAVSRLLNHEPVQYITGVAHFYGCDFHVNPCVLIPRPETEELVSWIIADHEAKDTLSICDIGAGSGCIAIALQLNLHGAEVDALDVSEEALEIARMNNHRLGSRVAFHHINILQPSKWPLRSYDIIVSNPPYIPVKQLHALPHNVAAYEPAIALFVPDDNPLIFYRSIASFSIARLKSTGKLYVEVHEEYAEAVVDLFVGSQLKNVILRTDINGKKRMIRAELHK